MEILPLPSSSITLERFPSFSSSDSSDIDTPITIPHTPNTILSGYNTPAIESVSINSPLSLGLTNSPIFLPSLSTNSLASTSTTAAAPNTKTKLKYSSSSSNSHNHRLSTSLSCESLPELSSESVYMNR